MKQKMISDSNNCWVYLILPMRFGGFAHRKSTGWISHAATCPPHKAVPELLQTSSLNNGYGPMSRISRSRDGPRDV